ncbi:hypothetical protein RchiOBHm_Chr5g0016181 [Rosa chinensis]|uniref:Uncharacterized protein n=1 Tax=Rosa chinensis TaxID=74649 RepID=A0A2P6Q661_ROSCH|nr:hypothetical protein RchiOBHm_Chr5g0016181 [Rosa chinensis]
MRPRRGGGMSGGGRPSAGWVVVLRLLVGWLSTVIRCWFGSSGKGSLVWDQVRGHLSLIGRRWCRVAWFDATGWEAEVEARQGDLRLGPGGLGTTHLVVLTSWPWALVVGLFRLKFGLGFLFGPCLVFSCF